MFTRKRKNVLENYFNLVSQQELNIQNEILTKSLISLTALYVVLRRFYHTVSYASYV